jgi:hypothetical protein
MKVYDTDKHGKFLIEEKPEVNILILNWLKKYLYIFSNISNIQIYRIN